MKKECVSKTGFRQAAVSSLVFWSALLTAGFLGDSMQAQSDPAREPAVLAVRKVFPAVVNINTERVVRSSVADPFDAFFHQFFGQPGMSPPREVSKKVQSLGSGFIVDPEGFIITNEHVVERAAGLKIQVTLQDGTTHTARYITGDPKIDLALIKIEGGGPYPHVDLKEISPNLLGQSVIVLGNPLGYGSTITRGILSAVGRQVMVENTEFSNLVQTDAAINPGNSGGPMVDLNGNLVGVSSVKLAYTSEGLPTQGIGFAIPATTVKEKFAEFRASSAATGIPRALPADGGYARRLFGVHLQELTPELADSLGFPRDQGVLITEVDAGSPGATAGLLRGLVIYQVGRYQVTSVADCERFLGRIQSGAAVDLLIGLPGNGVNPATQAATMPGGIRTEIVRMIAR